MIRFDNTTVTVTTDGDVESFRNATRASYNRELKRKEKANSDS